MDPFGRFAALVLEPDPPLDLGAALIAACARPDVDAAAQVDRLDDLARGCPEASLEGLRAYLFEELGFSGNRDDYTDPANSYLDTVLDRRLGIPITLAAVTMEVGRRVGIHLGGVGMPGHFLVRHLDEPELFVDAFDGGRFLGAHECRTLFERLNAGIDFQAEFLSVVDHRTMLWRMLSNLRHAFARRGDLRGLRWVLELQLAFPDAPVGERRRVAAMLGMTGRLDAAADALDDLAHRLEPDDAGAAREQARALRARMN